MAPAKTPRPVINKLFVYELHAQYGRNAVHYAKGLGWNAAANLTQSVRHRFSRHRGQMHLAQFETL